MRGVHIQLCSEASAWGGRGSRCVFLLPLADSFPVHVMAVLHLATPSVENNYFFSVRLGEAGKCEPAYGSEMRYNTMMIRLAVL